MGILGYLLLGLIAGAIARAILPGRQAGGWVATLVLGVIGALLGGFIGNALFDVGLNGFFNLSTWILAIVGSLIVLVIYGATEVAGAYGFLAAFAGGLAFRRRERDHEYQGPVHEGASIVEKVS